MRTECSKNYEALLFDVDGTLLDFDKAEECGIEALLRCFGVPVTEEHKMKYHLLNQRYWTRLELGELTRDQVLFQRFEEFFGGFGIRVDGREVDLLYRETLDHSAVLIEGALEIMKYLKNRYQIYAITNGGASTQKRRLRDSGLESYFDGIFISETAEAQKPQKKFFDYCFEQMGRRDVEHMLVIGDSLSSDIRGANGCGIDACWFNPNEKENDAGVRVDIEIRKLKELEEFL